MARVAVIGAGISGLATAWFARELGHEVQVFEQSKTCGGYLSSRQQGDLMLEFGATTLRLENQPTLALIQALQLDKALVDIPVRTLAKYIVTNHGPTRLRRVGPPTILREFASISRLLSHAAGIRTRPAADTNLQAYVEQVAGPKAAPLARALARGLVGADAETLSAAFVLGQFRYHALAQQRRMLRALRPTPDAVTPVRSVWIRGGNQQLATKIAQQLPAIHTGVSPTLAAHEKALEVQGAVFDRVVIATDVKAATAMVQKTLPALAETATAVEQTVPAGTIANHTLVWDTPSTRLLHKSPLEGAFGVLNGDRDSADWFGLQFASHMAPERCSPQQTMAGLVAPDAHTAETVAQALCADLNIPRPDQVIPAPKQAFLPHPRPGFQDSVGQLQAQCRAYGILFAGNWLTGAGVPKCIAQAHSIAARL